MGSTKQLRFHFDWKDHWIDAKDAELASRDIMHQSAGRMMNVQNYFNDYSLYKWLKSTQGCSRVELGKLLVFHSDYFVFGLQSVYRVTYYNGESREIAAEKHVYASGFYAHGGPPKVTMLELEPNEFIQKVVTRQGEIVDQLTFVTNMRRVSLGGTGGMQQEEVEHFDGVMSRIVAFTGTKAGALERIGYFLEPVNWEEIRSVVLTRKLLEKGRAESISNETSKEEPTLLNSVLTKADDDVFQTVIGFLIFQKPSSKQGLEQSVLG